MCASSCQQVLEQTMNDASGERPLYCILSPGVDVRMDVERMAVARGMVPGVTFINVSLGQGQVSVAHAAHRATPNPQTH